jgi:cysteine desulfurase
MQNEIYLDNSATTRPYDEVIDYMRMINQETYGNPSSLHRKGIEAEKLIKKARTAIAASLKVEDKEIIFTSGGTEANNLAITGYLEANPRKGKHIITTQIEHPSVLEVFKNLEGKGYEVDFVGVNTSGKLNLAELRNKIRPSTALISIMFVNNEIGTIQSFKDIMPMIKSINKTAVIHVDGVQAYGKLPIEPKKLDIDLLTVSSHKIHGPKGVGALYLKRNTKLKPIIFGGGQEALLRAGTENVSGVCGFGKASEMIFDSLSQNALKVEKLKAFFVEKLPHFVEHYDIISTEDALPNILNISFSSVRAEVLLHHLEEKNIFVSTGSACSSRKNMHSHVLKAIGLDAKIIEGALRFSFSEFNNEAEIQETLNALKEIIPIIKMKRKR